MFKKFDLIVNADLGQQKETLNKFSDSIIKNSEGKNFRLVGEMSVWENDHSSAAGGLGLQSD
jgi:hypothetical protein